MYLFYGQPDAVASVEGGPEVPELSGEVSFYQRGGSVLVVTAIANLPRSETGFFGLHIHEGNLCRGKNFADTGSHYNPSDVPHPGHAGDLPPLLSCGGRAYLAVCTDRFRVEDLIGRTVVIHSGADDFRSQPAGNAGNKIACGIIRRP